MWLIRNASRSKSMAYISVNCVGPQSVRAAHIREAVIESPSAANPYPLAIRLEAAASGRRVKRPSSAMASKCVE
jgi:hypothetical protein